MFTDDVPFLLKTDSYKISHWKQYPPNTTELMTYIESRGGPTDGVIFFGLQMFIEELAKVRVTRGQVERCCEWMAKHLGSRNPVPYQQLMRIPEVHDGKIPLEIKAVKEGTYVSNHNVFVTVRSTDPELFWLTSFMETQILRAVWYPTTVATISNSIKQRLYSALSQTADSTDGINFKLHDFGARGVSSGESAGIGGAAHLANFWGSDTMEGIWYANNYYDCEMAGFSIPAAEHSTITTWLKEHEREAYKNMLERFDTPLIAVVSDSYDLNNAVRNIWGKELKQAVIDSGKLVVIRPDSGDPPDMVLQTLQGLDEAFGSTINTKGFKVLNHVRVIQGDGIDDAMIGKILAAAVGAGFSADNLAFGMGGALLQHANRDTYRFANKCCLAKVDGKYRPIFKDPITDPGKRSKSGMLDLVKAGHGYMTVDRLSSNSTPYLESRPSELDVVYLDGEVKRHETLADIRQRIDSRIAAVCAR